jgi:hypothetical protein
MDDYLPNPSLITEPAKTPDMISISFMDLWEFLISYKWWIIDAA